MIAASRNHLRWLQLALFVMLSFALGRGAYGDVVITTFDQANLGDGWGPDKQIGVAVLVSNTVVNVTNVQMRQNNPGISPTTDETFAIYARGADGKLGALLFQDFSMSFSVDNIATGTPNTPLTLGPNQGYWLVMNSGPSDVVNVDAAQSHSFTAQPGVSVPAQSDPVNLAIMVNPGSGPQYGPADFNPNSQTGNPIPIFQINGTLVPEPSSLALVGIAGIGMLRGRRRARI